MALTEKSERQRRDVWDYVSWYYFGTVRNMLDKQAVFFDIDDTLLDNYCAFKETIQEFFPGSLNEFALKRLYRNFRQNSEKIYQSYLDGNRKHKADRWRLVLQTLQPTSIVNISELDDYYHLRQGKTTPIKRDATSFAKLKEKRNLMWRADQWIYVATAE